MSIILWILLAILGLAFLVGILFLIGWGLTALTSKRLEKRYTKEKDYGRRITNGTPEKVRNAIAVGKFGNSDGTNTNSTGAITNNTNGNNVIVEKLKRAFRKVN